MFTGLVEEVGRVVRLAHREGDGATLTVQAERVLEGTRLGDSIDVNGACLTVVELGTRGFAVECMPETLKRSTVGSLRPGDAINLERALALGDRLGGHLVLGHVDGVGTVQAVRQRGIAWELRVSLPAELRGYVAPKGSVAVDGISLTVTDVTGDDFGLGLIPHTLAQTTLHRVSVGRQVNLEADVLARYVHHALLGLVGGDREHGGGATPLGGITEEGLRAHGFLD
jgi:riboflavin synthase